MPITILGLGSLLSARSCRTTFPDLADFRLARVYGYRRVFAHPAGIFFARGIASSETLEMSSLSAEECEGASFVCTAFEVEAATDEYIRREEEFRIEEVPFVPLDGPALAAPPTGLLCCRSTDEAFVVAWGREKWERDYASHGIDTIWGWEPTSGLRPCAVYLRHCVLAAERLGGVAYESFLDDTYLVDRTTTIRQYLAAYPEVMTTLPPPELAARYGG